MKKNQFNILKIKQKMVINITIDLYEHVYNIRKSIDYLD